MNKPNFFSNIFGLSFPFYCTFAALFVINSLFINRAAAQEATFNNDTLILPCVSVASVFYDVAMDSSNSDPLEFTLSSASKLAIESCDIASYAQKVLTIPALNVSGSYFAVTFSLISGTKPFQFRMIDSVEIEGNGAGLSSFEFYQQNVSSSIVQNLCLSCHTEGGPASSTSLLYVASNVNGYQQTNFTILSNYIEQQSGAGDLLLSKSSGQAIHGGGQQFSASSQAYANLQQFVDLVEAGN